MRLTLTDRLWLAVYSLALVLLLPTTLYHLVWRGMRQREYLQRWSERYAWFGDRLQLDGTIWVHCAAGYRASIAAGLLERTGRHVVLVDDRFPAGGGPASGADRRR